jgi:hypothetical protein
MKRTLLLLVFPLLFLQSCYLGSTLDTPTTMAIDENFEVLKITIVDSASYADYSAADEYKALYLEGLKSSLTASNVTVVDASANPDYTIVITWVKVLESSNTHTVSDEESEYNGQQYELTECEVDADVTMFKGTTRTNQAGTWIISASKEEKVKNVRNLGDRITGSNHDRTIYREKLLSADVFNDLATKCGRRTEAKITSKIDRQRKKGK